MYINPDTLPDDTKKFKYQAKANGPEAITITKKESEEFKFSFTKFYVRYHSAVPGEIVTFKFEAKRLELEE